MRRNMYNLGSFVPKGSRELHEMIWVMSMPYFSTLDIAWTIVVFRLDLIRQDGLLQ